MKEDLVVYYAAWPFFLPYILVPTGFAVFAAFKRRPQTGLQAGLAIVILAVLHGFVQDTFVHPGPTRNLLGSALGMVVGTLPFFGLSVAAPLVAVTRRTHPGVAGAVTFILGWLLVPLSGVLILLSCGFTGDCP